MVGIEQRMEANIAGAEQRTEAKYEALRHEISDLRKDMETKHEALHKDMVNMEQRMNAKLEKLSLRIIIWLGSIVFLAVNTGPILPKLFHWL